jgi:hypothetical protein
MRIEARSPAGFLLRGLVLFPAMLALWWLLLLNPLLDMLRVSAELALRALPRAGALTRITEETGGDWAIRMPLPNPLEAAARQMFGSSQTRQVKTRFLTLRLPRQLFIRFTMAMPLFWAIVLAAPLSWRTARAMAAGTALLAVLALVSSALYVAHTLQQQMPLVSSRAGVFLLDFSHYLNTDALPYVAAIVLALWLHADLRAQVFFRRPAGPAQLENSPSGGRTEAAEGRVRKGRGKKRGNTSKGARP